MKLDNAKLLYQRLQPMMKDGESHGVYTHSLKEGMQFVSVYSRGEGRDVHYLVNKKEKSAWMFNNSEGYVTGWSLCDVEQGFVPMLPFEAKKNLLWLRSEYRTFVDGDYSDGVIPVEWTLQPDGRYYCDSSGFGSTNDDEITFWGFIDTHCNVLIPFQPMDHKLRATYRKMAQRIAKGEAEYVCMHPALTIPFEETQNISQHTDKLKHTMAGIGANMYRQLLAEQENPTGKDMFITSASINNDETRRFEYALLLTKEEDNTYQLYVITSLFNGENEPTGTKSEADRAPLEDFINWFREPNAEFLVTDLVESINTLRNLI